MNTTQAQSMDFSKVLQHVISAALVVLLAAFVGVGQSTAQSNTYYVNGNGPGNDGFDGSQMAVGTFPVGPFATITQAISVAANGDTIVILAGDYTGNGVLNSTDGESLTFTALNSGGNINVIVDGFNADNAGDTYTLAQSGTGIFLTNADADELTLGGGSVNVTGGLTFASGATLTRSSSTGSLIGNAPTVTNLNVTFTGAYTANVTAGNELPSDIGTGVLTFAHTGALVTAPNAVSSGRLVSSSAGSFTMSGNVSTVTVGANSVHFTAASVGGTATFSGAVNAAGGIDTDAGATKTVTAGSVFAGNTEVDLEATGMSITMAALDLEGVNLDQDGTLTVTGALTLGNAGTGTRVDNDGTLTVGSVATEITDTAGDDTDVIYTLDNGGADTFTINGAITEYHVLDAGGGGAGDILDVYVALINGADGILAIGASSTIGGDIDNNETDGFNAAPDNTQGIVLNNNATLTVNLGSAPAGNITEFGDFIGGTLVVDYANGATNVTTAANALDTANNLTFTSNIDDDASGVNALSIRGNLLIQNAPGAGTMDWDGTITALGTLTITGNGQDFDAAVTVAGIDVGTTTGHTFAGVVTVSGATAVLSNSAFAAGFVGGSTAEITTNGASFAAGVAGKTITVSGATTLTGALDASSDVTINAGASLTQSTPGNTSDVDGNLVINGTYTIDTAAGDLAVDGDMTINSTTGTFVTADQLDLTLGGSFTGGTYTDTGTNDIVTLNTPSGGSTIGPKPGTTVGSLVVNGSGRTATFSESITVGGNVTIGNDVVVALGDNSIIVSGAAATFTLTDEAQITNNGTNGSVQFTGNAQVLTVAGTPTTTPSLQNIVVNNAGATDLTIDENLNITGTLALLDGGVEIDGVNSGANATAMTLTFTGSGAKIARVIQNEGIDLVATNTIAGTYDLELSGTTGTAAGEYDDDQMRNITVSATGAVTFPATVASISGNLSVTNATGSAITAANLTVAGNVTATGSITIADATTLATAGVVTVADEEVIGEGGAGTAVLQLTGASQSHSLVGEIEADLKLSATGITLTGSADASADASELVDVISDAASSATFTAIQDITGTVTVNGTLAVTLDDDAGTGTIAGAVTVNNGGALTVSSDAATSTFAAAVTVNDGGTLTAGSAIGFAGAVTLGNTSQATAATLDLNGQTVTMGDGADVMTAVASTGATAPSFGTSGTLTFNAAASIAGATNPTIPNVTINGGTPIDSDITVTGTFTVAAASAGVDGDDVTLSGSGAIGQFNANYTGTAGAAGSTIITTGTTIQSNVGGNVDITNLNVNSTSTTSLATNHATNVANNFRVDFFNHDAGVFDLNGQNLTILGDDAGGIDWDHDGGSYAATGGGTIVIDDDGDAAVGGAEEILVDLTGAVSVANLTVVDAATGGLQLSASDALTVTGTLTVGGGAGNVDTENGANDATLTIGNGGTIVRSSVGVTDHFDNDPSLGTGLTVRYTGAGATTTGDELPTTLARLEWEGGAFTLTLEDAVALTLDYLENGGLIDIDANDDSDNSISINANGTLEYDADGANFTSVGVDEVPTFGGAATLFFNNATLTTSDTIWPDALTGSTVTLTVHGSAGAATNDTVTLHEARTVGSVTAGDGTATATNGSGTLATGANTLTASSITVNADGFLTGNVNVSGAITNSGSLTANVTSQADVTLTGTTAATNPGSLTLNGTAAQTLTVPAAGAMLTAFVVNNAAGVTVSGGDLGVGSQTVGTAVTAVASGLTLTSGTLNMGGNTLILPHGGSGLQGFTRTNGCVFGNVRKALSNTTNTAPADRMEFPLCTIGGIYRPYAITFNNPNTIGGLAPNAMGTTAAAATGSSAPALTARHDRSGENGVAVLAGTNGLNTTVNGVNIARYPTLPNFFWTVSPNFTMSPSLTYDLDMRANDYANFSASCGAAACDINEIFPIRRHVGSDNNLWAVSSSNLNNFLAGADDPVVVATGATGTLQTSGTIFTYGLKSIFAASGSIATVTTTTGNTHDIDANTLFTGFQGNVQNVSVAGGGTNASATVAGTTITVTGGADAGSTTLTVTAEDSFGTSATASQPVDNSTALAGTAPADRTINLTNTFDVDMTTVFSGGAGTATYGVASDNGNATVTLAGNTATVTGATAGASVITLTATDQSSTPVVVNVTFNVTVNTSVAAGALGNQTVVDNATVTQDVSATFSGGTVAGAYAVTATTSDAAIATVVSPVVGNSVEVTGASPYVITGTTVADAPPVTITVTGTDDLGESASTTYTVDVTPVQGDVDGDGDADIFDAVAVLDFAVGIGAPAPGSKQFAAADWNSNGTIQSFDAFAIFNATTTPKAQKEIVENAVADLAWGEVMRNELAVELPVTITGDINAAVAAQLWTKIDPEVAKVTGVTFLVEDAIASAYHVTEEGDLSLAVIGGYMPADGIMATISLELFDSAAEFEIAARGAVNNNAAADIDDLEVLELPEAFALLGNYPNPFNPSTNIQFDLPASSEVSIEVYDMLGRRVMVVPAQTIQAGAKRSLQINASALASGSYFYRVIAKAESSVMVDSGRMLLVK